MLRAVFVIMLASSSGVAHADSAPRWQFTEGAEWVDATVKDAGLDSIGTSVQNAAEARAVVKARNAPPLVSLWVAPKDICAVAPGLAGTGRRIAVNVDGNLTAAASTCLAEIAPSALTVATGQNLPLLPGLRALAIITATDAELSSLAGFRALESLVIGHAFTDEGLAHISSLRGLRSVELIGAEKVGAGVGKLTGVRSLVLGSMTVQRAHLDAVGSLRELRKLDLGHAGVDGGDLVALAKLTKLASLNVRSDALPAALAPIGKLRALRSLGIRGTELDDGAVATLVAWSKQHRRVKVTR